MAKSEAAVQKRSGGSTFVGIDYLNFATDFLQNTLCNCSEIRPKTDGTA